MAISAGRLLHSSHKALFIESLSVATFALHAVFTAHVFSLPCPCLSIPVSYTHIIAFYGIIGCSSPLLLYV